LRAFISTVPFAEFNTYPLDLLREANIDYSLNPYGRKLHENELGELIGESDYLIAGTEIISQAVLRRATNLKLIARVGIGLDSVNLIRARTQNVIVTYTPDGPSPAVAELTLGLMINLLRSIHLANAEIHNGEWKRYSGRRLSKCTIGIIGAGRIGVRVLAHLAGFHCHDILVNDLQNSVELGSYTNCRWADKATIYKNADVITLHVPLTEVTRGMISYKELSLMKPGAVLVNTSRGGIVDESALYDVMKDGHLSGAAIDTFLDEPYNGPLKNLDRCLLTAHMGSMSNDCRAQMEIEATEEVVRLSRGEKLKQLVPEFEYENQQYMNCE